MPKIAPKLNETTRISVCLIIGILILALLPVIGVAGLS